MGEAAILETLVWIQRIMENDIRKLRVSIPEGKSGDWSVSKFSVSQKDAEFHNLRCAINPRSAGREIEVGEYTQLKRGGCLVMSDVPAEIRDHMSMYYRAKGNVLIAGLGLGWITLAVASKPEVKSITVVELSPDVISLVGPTIEKQIKQDFKIVQADINEFKPARGSRFDAVWLDIWNDICSDNLKGMKQLKRRFKRISDWVECWSYYETLRGW